ncbi:MAG TPA: type I DNA topoisomerase [Verrucomicrobiae bacterium]|nr:type I DNA topoisomerase [Verrucomicrobiae bacterium]
MAKKLVIVESPAKAKTINKYLGSDFSVKASMGHVRDLPERKFGVEIENDFEPTYEISKKKGQVVNDLKQAAKDAETVYLASDPDREGEAIAWHLQEILKSKRNGPAFFRVQFNEITKNAVRAAFDHPGNVDMKLVDSQQARRILDRIVGYKISPLLNKRVARGLSAGRVQSVAVRLVVDREREIRAFKPQEYWSVEAELRKLVDPKDHFLAKLIQVGDKKVRSPNGELKADMMIIGSQEQADRLLSDLQHCEYKVAKIDIKPKKRSAPPPFTTSTLQQSASKALGMGTSKTMMVAQQLYEGMEIGDEGSVGLITYMRTDSFNVSKEAQAEALAFIRETIGPDYAPESPNFYKSKKDSQGAHEAVRPTSARRTPDSVKAYLDHDQFRLYKLIWERFVASQMTPAEMKVTSVDIDARRDEKFFLFRATATEVVFAGWLKIYGVEEEAEKKAEKEKPSEEEENKKLPPLSENERLQLIKLHPEQHFTEPPPRFSEATLVKALEELGIGRPSTYAPTIATIQKRHYVLKEKGRLSPTQLGEVTTDILVKHFTKLLDVQFTAQMEELLDEIEEGKVEWHHMLGDFYKEFAPTLKAASENMEDVRPKPIPTDIKCEVCGEMLVIRPGKNGEFLACSAYPKCKNTKNFKRGEDGSIQVIEKEETGVKCEKCGSPMVIKAGKRGEFLACSGYPDCKNAKSFTRDEAGKITVIEKPQPVATDIKCEKCGSPMVIRNSRRGPFLACSGYPKCRNAKPLPDELKHKAPPPPPREEPVMTDEKCEKCGAPMVKRRGRFGEFLGCSAYPKCKNIKKLAPVAA